MGRSGAMGLSYEVVSRLESGTPRPMARMVCAQCGGHAEIFAGNIGNNPEAIGKAFTKAGWEADPWQRRKCRCPECIGGKRKSSVKRGEDDRGRKVVAMSKPETKPVSVVSVREPTNEHRLRIRQALDANFDDSRGCYLAGYSDQKIGEELKVPWKWVEQIREAAYGPIRADPEIEALRNDIAALRDSLVKAEERLAAIEKRFRG